MEFREAGATNRDWENVDGQEGGTSFLYDVDTAGKAVYKVAEPDPARPGRAAVAAT